MSDIDISQLSALQLKALRDSIESQLVDRELIELDKLRAEILELCSSRGYTLQQVIAPLKKKTSKAKNAGPHFVKGQLYQNPDNPAESWKGFGGRPLWLRDFLAKGGSIEQLTPSAPSVSPTPPEVPPTKPVPPVKPASPKKKPVTPKKA